jgi:hypothetical protein
MFPVGLAIKAAIGFVIAAVWTSTPGAEEARSVQLLAWASRNALRRCPAAVPRLSRALP